MGRAYIDTSKNVVEITKNNVTKRLDIVYSMSELGPGRVYMNIDSGELTFDPSDVPGIDGGNLKRPYKRRRHEG